MENTIIQIWGWITILSSLALTVLYPALALIWLYILYRWKLERHFRKRIRNALSIFSTSSLDETLLYIDIFYRQSKDLQKWHPELIDILEYSFSWLLLPSAILKANPWSSEEITRLAEVLTEESRNKRLPKLNPELQSHFDIVRSIIENHEPPGLQQSLLNLARSTRVIEKRNRRRQIENRISWIFAIVTLALQY